MSHKMVLVVEDVDGDELRCETLDRNDEEHMQVRIGDDYVLLGQMDAFAVSDFLREWGENL